MNFIPQIRIQTPSSWNRIQSPRFLDFDAEIPEAKDSFFDRKGDDPPFVKEQRNSYNFRLPFDDEWEIPKTTDDRKNLEITAPTPTYLAPAIWASTPVTDVAKVPKIETESPKPNNVAASIWDQTSVENKKTKPFSFEERNKQLLQRKARRIEMILQAEKDARKFRANPIPSYLKKLSKKTSEDNNCTNATAAGRKNPCPISPKQGSGAKPFFLHTEVRARERKVYQDYIKEKKRLEEETNQLMEASMKKREQSEIKMLRSSLVPKAHPIRKYKWVPNFAPKRELTEPITPTVLKRRRLL